MSIVKNFWLQDQTKKLAGAVIYQAMGQTRSRRLASKITNPRTESQMSQRVKWANLVNFYRANSTWMKYAFETKKPNQSEYNKLMSLNVSSSPIFLTKQQAATGACVVAPYIVTQGSLPSIELTGVDNVYTSNIFTMDASGNLLTGSVANFSDELLRYNPAIREGDQLSVIKISQQTNAVTGMPYIVVRKYELIISRSAQGDVPSYLPTEMMRIASTITDNPIMFDCSEHVGAIAVILSRTIAGKTYVSTQRLILSNVDELYSLYSSAQQLEAAVQSYGESEEVFLSSTYADRAPLPAVPVSITGVLMNSVQLPLGHRYVMPGGLMSYPVRIQLNQPIEASSGNIFVDYWSNGHIEREVLLEATIDGNVVSGTFPASAEDIAGLPLASIGATWDGGSAEVGFLITNADTIGGLE